MLPSSRCFVGNSATDETNQMAASPYRHIRSMVSLPSQPQPASYTLPIYQAVDSDHYSARRKYWAPSFHADEEERVDWAGNRRALASLAVNNGATDKSAI